jgi:hypothetical protein
VGAQQNAACAQCERCVCGNMPLTMIKHMWPWLKVEGVALTIRVCVSTLQTMCRRIVELVRITKSSGI